MKRRLLLLVYLFFIYGICPWILTKIWHEMYLAGIDSVILKILK